MALPESGPLALTDIQTEFGGSNPIGMNEYYAGGGLVPSGTTGTYGAVPSSGALSVQNFYGTSNFIPVYIEELFSTYLYTGNGTDKTIVNDIDLAGNGGLTWIKSRNNISTVDHLLFDTARGDSFKLSSNLTANSQFQGAGCWSPTSSGFFVANGFQPNYNTDQYASWTFRKQPKFFDVVTYTGNGDTRTISHNLGSVPGMVIIKATSGDIASSQDWAVWHRSLSTGNYILLNQTAAQSSSSAASIFGNNSTTVNPTSTTFTVGNGAKVNYIDNTYVAYLFAHDAGGFGLTGTDNVISCGSFTTNGGGNATVNLGYEPQWILVKRTDTGGPSWLIFDNMRGLTVSGNCVSLAPNNSTPDTVQSSVPRPNTTGFTTESWSSSATYIYVAIRRGLMKVPTDATKVYNAITYTGDGTARRTVSTTIQPDLLIQMNPSGNDHDTIDRLRGVTRTLYTNLTYADDFNTNVNKMLSSMTNTGFVTGSDGSNYWNASGQSKGAWAFRRAAGFFDEVCYTGTGVAGTTVAHNLTVVPELILVKQRNTTQNWYMYLAPLGNVSSLILNTQSGIQTPDTLWNSTTPTASVFSLGFQTPVNGNGGTYVAYLFASTPGVCKVGSYTGTGALQTIDCGFTSGARFVLIKRYNKGSLASWYIWDSARGITSGNDPYLLLNNVNAEVTNTNYVDTTSVGFQVTAAAPIEINGSGGTYIFLAIA